MTEAALTLIALLAGLPLGYLAADLLPTNPTGDADDRQHP